MSCLVQPWNQRSQIVPLLSKRQTNPVRGLYQPLPPCQSIEDRTDGPPRDHYRKFRRGRFQLFRLDQMHGITTARPLSSRASTSWSRQTDVCLVQNVRRYWQSNSVHAFRCRTSHSRNVLHRRIDEGYCIVQMHEVCHFPQKTDTFFNTFAKIKLEASGYAKNCVRNEQKQWYVNDILENQGIQLDPTKIAYNPGLRALAKLMLNSFWGKVAQRSNLVKTEQIDNLQVFFDCLTSDEITVFDADLVSDEILEIRYEYATNSFNPIPIPNVVIAAFTTAYAHLQLYDELDMLQEHVLYYDTDSVIYLSQPGQPKPQMGNYIGDLIDELGG